MKTLMEGMRLEPGESASCNVPMEQLIRDPVLRAQVLSGEKTLNVRQGPQIEDEPGHYHNECDVMIDGKIYAQIQVSWETK